MALAAVWSELDLDFNGLSSHFRDFAARRPQIDGASHFSVLDECLLEGLLSRAWQAWCRFCRRCVIESCTGTVDAKGSFVLPIPEAVSVEHVSGAAILAKKGKPPYWGTPNITLRLEPTWGDPSVLNTILTKLQPANSANMLAALSSGSSSAKALQLIRNGAAHSNSQTLGQINSLRSAYIVYPITHPVQAMFWTEPQSNDFLVTHALDDLKHVALSAIS